MRKQLTFMWVRSLEDCLGPNEGELRILQQSTNSGKIERTAFTDFADLWLLGSLSFYLLHSPDDTAAYDLINDIYKPWEHHFDHQNQVSTWSSDSDKSSLIQLRKDGPGGRYTFELRDCVGTLSPILIPDEQIRKKREEEINELLKSTLRLNL